MNCPKCGAPETDRGAGGYRLYFKCRSWVYANEAESRLFGRTDLCHATEALNEATDLLEDIMNSKCNAADEAGKWLRAYAPGRCYTLMKYPYGWAS